MGRLRNILRGRRVDILAFVAIFLALVAGHALLRTLGLLALPILALAGPFLFFAVADRSRGNTGPTQLANFFGAVTLAGIVMFLPAVAVIAGTGLSGMGLAWFAARRSLKRFQYVRTLTASRVFPDDEVNLVIHIANRKLLPLSWFEIADPIQVRGGSSKHRMSRLLDISVPIEPLEQHLSAIVQKGAVGPYQVFERTVRIKALHRGVYAFGPARFKSGDPFGFFTRQTETEIQNELIVYPRLPSTQAIEPSFWAAMGTLAARRALFEDPSLLAGSREYHPDDPLRHIHWKATARTGDLQVRIHDPATTTHIMIVLNLHTYLQAWEGVDPERMEAAIEVAAAVAVSCLERGLHVGIQSNGAISDVERSSCIVPGASPQQAATLLEYLARLSYWGGYSPDAMLHQEAQRHGQRTSIIFVTPVITPGIQEALTSPALRNRTSVVYCGRFAAPLVPGIAVHLAAPAEGRSEARAAS